MEPVMHHRLKVRWPLIVSTGAVIVLAGCITKTPVSGNFPKILPRQAQTGIYDGRTVRWGGVLIKTLPKARRTCFRVLGLPLASNGRPQIDTAHRGAGRFIACARGFYDPFLYAPGRAITFIGTVSHVQREKIGSYRYPYLILNAHTVYLWPKHPIRPRRSTYYYIYASPFWGFWGPYWGPYAGWGGSVYWGNYPGRVLPPAHPQGTHPPPPPRGHFPVLKPRPPMPLPPRLHPYPIRLQPYPPELRMRHRVSVHVPPPPRPQKPKPDKPPKD